MRAWIASMVAVLNGCTTVDLAPTADDQGADQVMCDTWDQLTSGQTIGKRMIITAASQPSGGVAVSGQVDLINFRGDDADACQMVVTLTPPQAFMQNDLPGGVFPVDPQNLTLMRTWDTFYSSPPAVDFTVPPAVAIVRWGIGGVESLAEVDFSHGLTINLQASFLRVSAFLDIPAGTFYPGTVVQLGAFAGPGRARRGQAQRSYAVNTVSPVADAVDHGWPTVGYGANGYTTVIPSVTLPAPATGRARLFPVPPFAKTLAVISNKVTMAIPFATADMDLVFFRDILGNKPCGAYHITANTPGPVAVPNGAAYWTLHNNTADEQNAVGVFDLDL